MTRRDANECIYCSVSSYSVASRGQAQVKELSSNLMTCLKCRSKFCNRCVQEIIELVETAKKIPASVKREDLSYNQMKEISSRFLSGRRTIFSGPCCSFIHPSSSSSSSSALMKTASPNPYTPCNRKKSIKEFRSSINKKNPEEFDCPSEELIPLYQYFDNPKHTSHEGLFLPKENPADQHMRILTKQKRRNHYINHINSSYNPFSGALIIPTFGLAIQGEVTNTHWYCDHHGFARSSVDGTPDVPHCVLSHDSARQLHESNIVIPRIMGSRTVINLQVTSPENPFTSRNINVEVIDVNQQLAISSIKTMKGENVLDLASITTMSFFGSEDIRPDVEVTIILGHFSIDTNIHPKLLLLRFTGMLANCQYSVKRKHEIARELYHQLRAICGRQGYEITRRGGSSGKVTNVSDHDLIDCIHDVPGLCPRKLRGVLILRGVFTYFLVYRNVKSSSFVCYQYPPPKEGGSFNLPSYLIYCYPVLAEFGYLKMIAIEILRSLNSHRARKGMSPVAQGILQCESMKLNQARKLYKKCDITSEQRNLYALVTYFNNFHKYSMVCHPVGMHNDHFKAGDESLENKILMSIDINSGRNKRLGRGGCVMGTQYVYALLDW
jgi:hypothetical protein